MQCFVKQIVEEHLEQKKTVAINSNTSVISRAAQVRHQAEPVDVTSTSKRYRGADVNIPRVERQPTWCPAARTRRELAVH